MADIPQEPILWRIAELRAEAEKVTANAEWTRNRPSLFHAWAGIAASLYAAELYARDVQAIEGKSLDRPEESR